MTMEPKITITVTDDGGVNMDIEGMCPAAVADLLAEAWFTALYAIDDDSLSEAHTRAQH